MLRLAPMLVAAATALLAACGSHYTESEPPWPTAPELPASLRESLVEHSSEFRVARPVAVLVSGTSLYVDVICPNESSAASDTPTDRCDSRFARGASLFAERCIELVELDGTCVPVFNWRPPRWIAKGALDGSVGIAEPNWCPPSTSIGDDAVLVRLMARVPYGALKPGSQVLVRLHASHPDLDLDLDLGFDTPEEPVTLTVRPANG